MKWNSCFWHLSVETFLISSVHWILNGIGCLTFLGKRKAVMSQSQVVPFKQCSHVIPHQWTCSHAFKLICWTLFSNYNLLLLSLFYPNQRMMKDEFPVKFLIDLLLILSCILLAKLLEVLYFDDRMI